MMNHRPIFLKTRKLLIYCTYIKANFTCILLQSKSLHMGLQTGLLKELARPTRMIRILIRMFTVFIRLVLQKILPFGALKNYNTRDYHTGIGQPKYFNSFKDFVLGHFLKSVSWVRDLSKSLQNDNDFDARYMELDYDTIVKSYFPTKLNSMETINIQKSWKYSYWNSANSNKGENYSQSIRIYRMSDVLFADTIINAQGIYKVKKVKFDTKQYSKIQLFFGNLLQKYHSVFKMNDQEDVINNLIKQNNLYFLDYPILRQIEAQRKKQNRYWNKKSPSSGPECTAYIEIPFAIFSQVQDFARKGKDFICLASVFNQTYYKNEGSQIKESELFHCFSDDMFDRDRWEMAKIHISSVDTNDFTIRIHLGWLHYGSSIYTTAFHNLANRYNLKWFKDEFVDVFSNGLLQVNFMANLSLIDHKKPMIPKIFYLNREQCVKMIIKQNNGLNMLQFDPEHLQKDSYESQSIKMTRNYYGKLRCYINYLFEKYEKDLKGRQKQFANFLFNQLIVKDKVQVDRNLKKIPEAAKVKLDGLPQSFREGVSHEQLKKLMTNLAYLWTIVHAQTFSLVSVACTFYTVPPFVAKPLSELSQRREPLDEYQKRDFLPPKQVIKDSLTLHKVVTYRQSCQSIVSRWNELPADKQTKSCWQKIQEQRQFERHFHDEWIDVTEANYKINYQRNQKGLYDLHWLMPHEIPMSLNI